jgi:Spy/CpxP family protein refolding chaperone
MKHLALTLSITAAALVAIPSTTFAQEQPAGGHPNRPEGAARPDGPDGGRRMGPEARLKFMAEKLGLDADQQAKIKAIYEKNALKVKEIMAKGWANLTDEDKAAMRDLFKSQVEEVAAVLTPEQQEMLKALRPQGRGEAKPEAAK